MNREDALWQSYNELKNHLELLSTVVMQGKKSAALQFAIQSKEIIN